MDGKRRYATGGSRISEGKSFIQTLRNCRVLVQQLFIRHSGSNRTSESHAFPGESGTQYDVAHVKWVGSWRMPTADEFVEFINEWTTINGVNGRKFTSKKNGNSIVLLAAGSRLFDSIYYAGSYGDYWSSSLSAGGPISAGNLGFSAGNMCTDSIDRCSKQSVRPVSE